MFGGISGNAQLHSYAAIRLRLFFITRCTICVGISLNGFVCIQSCIGLNERIVHYSDGRKHKNAGMPSIAVYWFKRAFLHLSLGNKRRLHWILKPMLSSDLCVYHSHLMRFVCLSTDTIHATIMFLLFRIFDICSSKCAWYNSNKRRFSLYSALLFVQWYFWIDWMGWLLLNFLFFHLLQRLFE